MLIKDVADLEVYRLSLGLLKSIYALTSILTYSQNNLRDQVIRAAESIPPLIAEGFAKKKSPREFCRFLLMALGSSDEVISHLRIINLSSPSSEIPDLIERYKEISKKLNKLHAAWQKFS